MCLRCHSQNKKSSKYEWGGLREKEEERERGREREREIEREGKGERERGGTLSTSHVL